MKITRKGFYVIEGPDNEPLEFNVTSRDECYERITEDGRSGQFRIKCPDRTIDIVQPDPSPEPEPTPDPTPDPVPDPTPDPVPPPPTPTEWSEYRGIPDPSSILGFDVYGDYPTQETISGTNGDYTIQGQGTPSAPYLVDATDATFSKLTVEGEYVIVQGGTIRSSYSGAFRSRASNSVFRDIDVGGNNSNQGHGSACGLASKNVWLRGAVHNFGLLGPTAPEQDQHGFKLQGSDQFVLDCEAFELSGDSVQAGDASRGAATRAYVGGGWFHNNRENGVDIKDSTDCVVSGVKMSGFEPTNSSPGEAVILHDDCVNARVYDCDISDCRLGIVSSGLRDNVIDGNTIVADSVGIQLRNTQNITVTNNDITAPERIEIQGGITGNIQN